MEEKRSFWTTLPGILTGAAALITALTGSYLAFRDTSEQMPQPRVEQGTIAARQEKDGVLYTKTPWVGVEVWQEGTKMELRSNDEGWWRFTSSIKSRPIEFRISRKASDPSIGVLAWHDNSIFEFISGNVFHIPGTGIAGAEFGIPQLYLDKEGFNYYHNERMTQLSENSYAIFVSAISSGNVDIPINRYSGPIFIIVFRVPDYPKREVGLHDFEVIELDLE